MGTVSISIKDMHHASPIAKFPSPMGTVSISIVLAYKAMLTDEFPSPMGTVSISISSFIFYKSFADAFPSPMGTVSISMEIVLALIPKYVFVSVPYGDRVYLNWQAR